MFGRSRIPGAVAQHYVDTRNFSKPVSLKRAVCALKAALPDTDLTDAELSALVANAAVKARLVVDFDDAD